MDQNQLEKKIIDLWKIIDQSPSGIWNSTKFHFHYQHFL